MFIYISIGIGVVRMTSFNNKRNDIARTSIWVDCAKAVYNDER